MTHDDDRRSGPSRATTGWALFGAGLVLTVPVALAGPAGALLAPFVVVAMSVGLVMGLWPLLLHGPGPVARVTAAPASPRRRVPPSWEYYETWGRR